MPNTQTRPKQIRSTKIVATLGPASDERIEQLVISGVDAFRLNFSHGSHAQHLARIKRIREVAAKLNSFVAIIADLQGPKIRIGSFVDNKDVHLAEGAPFTIDTEFPEKAGTSAVVGTSYKSLAAEVSIGNVLVLGDGLMELEVVDIKGSKVHCRVKIGGELGGGKGINLKNGGLSAPALSDKDIVDLAFACSHGVDYLAISFARSAQDILQARALVESHKASCGIIAKLERAEAVATDENIDAIILASDGVMVARGDLGIEIGDAALMGMQKRIIAHARKLNRCVITATQMMESMITNPRPTRAEVMDVANAVLDGTDAVMLSGETAMGLFPVETVENMARVIEGAESSAYVKPSLTLEYECTSIDASIAMAAMNIAEHLEGVRAVACLTATGTTTRLMSRSRSRLPIYALSDSLQTLARVALFRGVHPRHFNAEHIDFDLINDAAIKLLQDDGTVTSGDRVILSKGDYRNVQGGTNTLKIVVVS